VLSLGNSVVGVMYAASLSVHAIGVGLAAAQELTAKQRVQDAGFARAPRRSYRRHGPT
jgi:hypothetical protein